MIVLRRLVIASCLVASLVSAGAARAAYNATLPVRHLSPEDAMQALFVRIAGLGDACTLEPHGSADPVTSGFRGTIHFACKADELSSKIKDALAAIDVAPPSQKFHVVVLAASRKEGSTPDLPPGEAKALADFKKVMTYKSFTFEAETMIASDKNVMTQLNDTYNLDFTVFKPAGSDVIDVKFQLTSLTPLPASNGGQQFRVYINTSFSIKVGETIVLGSSTSDQAARVVLVTAVP